MKLPIAQLVKDLDAAGVTVRLDGRRMKFTSATPVPVELLARMKEQKPALIEWLRFGRFTVEPWYAADTPEKAALLKALDERPWLTWAQCDELLALFGWYGGREGLNACLNNLRLMDSRANTKARAA